MRKNAVVVKVLIMGLIFALTLVAMPVGAASKLPNGSDIQGVSPSQSDPPSPYGIGQLLATFSFDHSQCWAHGNPYWDDLWRPCGASAETPGKTIEKVWPTTVDYFEFTLPSDGWIILEVEWITDDHYTGSMEWALQKRDETGEWSNIGVTHYATPVPSEYWDALRFNEDGNLRIWGGWLPEINPTETYQIFAWQRYDNWAPAYNNQFYFPAKGAIKVIFVPKPEDSDGDGVPDDIDECPGTPAGVAVDDKGCPVEAAPDSDGDGVADDIDACPGTPAGVAVNNKGCPVGALIVEIDTDKENYLIGETVHCTITVNDSNSTPVSNAELNIIATRLSSGKASELSGFTDVFGQNPWSFTWGKKDTGEAIVEGKLKVEVTASKEGYADGYKSITLSGCGDLECCQSENCFICEEDCKCSANEICDPLSSYRNQETLCSPKVAYIFISMDPELGAAQRLKMLPRINSIRKYYQSLGYKTSTVYVDDISDVAVYLSRLSTKAIAYFGHATEPSIEHSPPGDIQNNILQQFRKNYGAKYPDLKEEIKNKATERASHPDLDYAYMFTCHSLDDTSLRDYLLHSGGTYWGDNGKLYGLWWLQKSVKP